MPNELVIVVDDDPETFHLTKECLTRAGFRVLQAADGSVARQIVQDERPDLFILAVESLSISGFEFCKLVQDDSALKHTPVIFLDHNPSREAMIASFASGAHDYLAKPFDSEELLARARAAIRLKTAHDSLRHKNSKLEALVKNVRAALQYYEEPLNGAAGEAAEAETVNGDGKAIAKLTRREMEILQLLARGLSNEVISKQLYISPTTTRNHIQNILGKLGVHSKLEAVAHAVRAGYIDFVG